MKGWSRQSRPSHEYGGPALSREALAADPLLLRDLELIRGGAAARLGLIDDPATAASVTPAIPKLCLVAPPERYRLENGDDIERTEFDLWVRSLTMRKPHAAYQVTAGVCTAIAALLTGTVVSARHHRSGGPARLGHPSGVMSVDAEVVDREPPTILRAAQVRTARCLMRGLAFVPASRISEGAA